MLQQALVEPAEREAEIAAKVVDPCALHRKILGGGGRGLVEHGKRFVAMHDVASGRITFLE